MVGRLLSFWEDLFSEGMFVSGRVYLPLTHHPVNSHHQDYHTFSRGSLETFISLCSWQRYIHGSRVSSTVKGVQAPFLKRPGMLVFGSSEWVCFFGVLIRLVDDFHCHVVTCLCFHAASSLMDFVSTYKGGNSWKVPGSTVEVDLKLQLTHEIIGSHEYPSKIRYTSWT